jgi:hypothetical protein
VDGVLKTPDKRHGIQLAGRPDAAFNRRAERDDNDVEVHVLEMIHDHDPAWGTFGAKLKKRAGRAKLKTKLSLSAAVAKMEAHD